MTHVITLHCVVFLWACQQTETERTVDDSFTYLQAAGEEMRIVKTCGDLDECHG